MKNNISSQTFLFALCVTAALSLKVHAQTEVESSAPATVTTTTTTTTPVTQSEAIESVQAEVKVVEVVPSQPLVVEQPVTVIEATPLVTSTAEQMRKAREEAELSTEQKIVEKLEESRLVDEKKRADALFGGGLKAISDEQAPVQEAPKVEAPVEPVAPAPVAQPAVSVEELREAVRTELRASQEEVKPEVVEEKKSQYFVSGQAGMMDYGLESVESISAFGISIGTLMPSNWSVEASLLLSNHYVDESFWVYRELDQYNIGLLAKYNLQLGKVRPSAGLALSYTRREYSAPRDSIDGFSYDNIGTTTSQAFDYGFVAGLDFVASDNLTLGLEYRGMNNLSYKYENQDLLNTAGYRNNSFAGAILESRSYDVWGFNLRYMF